MDNLDKRLLNIIQSDFPVESRPYAALGRQLGITEAEALARVRRLRENGIIRRLGANFQAKELGWFSTLCAAKAPPETLDQFVALVNSHPEVTHNYLREHDFNVWFTLIAPTWERILEILAGITQATGVEILNLPADRLFKIKVDFQMGE